MKKFDVICGNPPYQDEQNHSNKRGGGTTLWDKFVDKAIDLTKPDGYICLVHPCGWRNHQGDYQKIGERIKTLQMHYLEMHGSEDGVKNFGAGTSYDWYVLQNTRSTYPTTIKCQNGEEISVDIKSMPFIPSGMFHEIKALLAKDNEERVQIEYSRSAYGSDKAHVQKTKEKTHPHPIIHNIKVSGELTVIYSSVNNKGFFGVPKVVFGKRQCGTFIDKIGKYGLSQHAVAIVDKVENLEKINTALNNPRFIEICKFLSLNSTAKDKYDYRTLALFRKDFWKEFI
jgi:hypothetical protein